mgnify:CR=1 FL=1
MCGNASPSLDWILAGSDVVIVVVAVVVGDLGTESLGKRAC